MRHQTSQGEQRRSSRRLKTPKRSKSPGRQSMDSGCRCPRRRCICPSDTSRGSRTLRWRRCSTSGNPPTTGSAGRTWALISHLNRSPAPSPPASSAMTTPGWSRSKRHHETGTHDAATTSRKQHRSKKRPRRKRGFSCRKPVHVNINRQPR